MRRPKIAYVAQYFPYMTETFVYREVEALQNKGIDVVTLSNRTPDINSLAEESKAFMDSTEYVFPIKWKPFIAAHAYFLLRHPIRYVSTLWHVMSPPEESMANRKRTFGHFMGAIYLAKQAKSKGIEHIHAHFSVNAATIGLVISRLLDISYSFTAHQIFFTDRLILKQKLKAAKFISVISNHSLDYLANYAPEITDLRDKAHIVHCGISPEQFQSKPSLNGSKPHKPIIFSLARTDEKKGMPYLVEACRLLQERGIDFECIIGGDGEEHVLLQQKVADYELEEYVKLPGAIFQQDLDPYLAKADMFVLAAITASNGDKDGIPVVLMESMAMEIPTISTYVSGIPELIENEVSGLLVPEKDPKGLADAIQHLIENPDFARELGIDGRKKVSAEFNIDITTDQLANLFKQYVR